MTSPKPLTPEMQAILVEALEHWAEETVFLYAGSCSDGEDVEEALRKATVARAMAKLQYSIY